MHNKFECVHLKHDFGPGLVPITIYHYSRRAKLRLTAFKNDLLRKIKPLAWQENPDVFCLVVSAITNCHLLGTKGL